MTTVPKPQVDPRIWHPPADPGLTGDYARNDRLANAERIRVPGTGPEDVAISEDGTLWTGTDDGSILRITGDGDAIVRVADTGGRPLGIELLPDGRVLVCDADQGLLAVDPDGGAVEPLVTTVDGDRLVFTNNATVADDGTIWFTDSSRTFPVQHYEGDVVEHASGGRLFRRDPDGTVTTVLDGLFFANGVALEPGGDSLLVAETTMYRILRVWLAGERAGRTEVFAEMPGFPDNLSIGPTGTVWCAIASSRNKLVDFLADKPPVLRRLAWALPEAVQPSPARQAMVVGYDLQGRVTHNLQSHGDAFTVSTGAREHDGALYIGSLRSDHLLRHQL